MSDDEDVELSGDGSGSGEGPEEGKEEAVTQTTNQNSTTASPLADPEVNSTVAMVTPQDLVVGGELNALFNGEKNA